MVMGILGACPSFFYRGYPDGGTGFALGSFPKLIDKADTIDGKFPRPLGPDGGTGFAFGSFPKLIDEADTVDGKFPRPLGPDGGTGFALGSFPKLIDEADTRDGKFPRPLGPDGGTGFAFGSFPKLNSPPNLSLSKRTCFPFSTCSKRILFLHLGLAVEGISHLHLCSHDN